MNKKEPHFFSGLSGIQLPVPKYKFPPEHQTSSRLSYYATFFNSIEINSSFYKIPMKSTVGRWAESVPENFRFTFKLCREITHAKELNFDKVEVERFIEATSAVGQKKGCLLLQFPPGLQGGHLHQLANLLDTMKTADSNAEWKIAVEFRNKTWYTEDTFDLLESYHATLVIHDIPASATPMTSAPSSVIYVRFHGPTGNYRGSYPHAFLREYAAYVKGWVTEGKSVYLYFNNTAGDAFNNLKTLNSFVL
jgi:uncharacterized protein YecE (DUF72 family)